MSLEDFARAPRNHDNTFTSVVSTANQITSLVGQNLADRPEFLSERRHNSTNEFLANDDIREHMGDAKNGSDRRLVFHKHRILPPPPPPPSLSLSLTTKMTGAPAKCSFAGIANITCGPSRGKDEFFPTS